VKLICVGKNTNNYVNEGIVEFGKRINRYVSFEIIYTKNIKITKSTNPNVVKKLESEQVMKNLESKGTVVLLDERGRENSSVGFSKLLQSKLSEGKNEIFFIIGGAYGFSDRLYNICDLKLSLSKMTFPHQLIRIMFLEQLYRAFTIINNEPYHNE